MNLTLIILNWDKLNIDLLVECTGIFTKREDAQKTRIWFKKSFNFSPATDPDITVVYGINHNQ